MSNGTVSHGTKYEGIRVLVQQHVKSNGAVLPNLKGTYVRYKNTSHMLHPNCAGWTCSATHMHNQLL